MNVSRMIERLQELKEKHGDITCVTEACEMLWKIKEEEIFFMPKRMVHSNDFDVAKIKDVIIIG